MENLNFSLFTNKQLVDLYNKVVEKRRTNVDDDMLQWHRLNILSNKIDDEIKARAKKLPLETAEIINLLN